MEEFEICELEKTFESKIKQYIQASSCNIKQGVHIRTKKPRV